MFWYETTLPPCDFNVLKTIVPIDYLYHFKGILDEWYDSQRLAFTSKTNAGCRICQQRCCVPPEENKMTGRYHSSHY